MQADGGRDLPLSMASAFDGFQDGLLGEILSHCFASMSPDDLARASSCCKAWADSNGWCENYAARAGRPATCQQSASMATSYALPAGIGDF